MKSSAWYHKLWRDKLDNLPLKKDDNTAWADMLNLLDENLPVNDTPFNKIIRYRIPAFATLKVIIAMIVISTITLPTVLYIAKHNTVLLKKGNHALNKVINNNKSPEQYNESLNQHLKDLIIPDSTHLHSNNSAESLIQNQKSSANSFNSSNKPVMVNHNLQPQNTDHLKTDDKHQKDDKVENDGLLSTPSATLQTNISKKRILKGGNRRINILTPGNNQKTHHLLISGHSSSTEYTSAKASHNKAAKNDLKTGEAFTTRANDINGNAITTLSNTIVQTTKTSKSNNDKEEADTKIDPVKSPTNNTDQKEVKSSGSRSRAFNTAQKTVKTKDNKTKSNTKKSKADDTPPKYNYGLEIGYNSGKSHSLYSGIFGSYQLKPKWLINVGLRLNTYTTISGEYSHQSYYSPDSIPAFKITDLRKVMALTVPLTLEYKLSKNISLKGGPVISMLVKQSAISTKLGVVPNIRDTVYHTRMIDSTLQKTTINKLNVGFTGGVSIQIKHFSIEAMYQVLTPYKVSSGLGSYQKTNQNLQIGIGYRFK